jgi:tubulin polyglutamylase TTLL9
VVVQRYLDRPYLIDGRKGHCRIYGLIASAAPLRAYVYSEGIVRIAPQLYDPSPEQAGAAAMHVTNTALHLGRPDLVICQDPAQEDTGAIRSLSALLGRMTADGLDGQAAFGEIKALVEWFVRLLSADGLFARQAASAPARGFAPKPFGLDVLVDDEGHPWLIEMQRTPAARGAPLVDRINAEMFSTVFRMGHFPLIDDATPADLVVALRTDDAARRRREAEIELANRGKFVPLDL